MTALDSVSLEALSDSDAVALLFELTGHGDDAGEQLLQLDTVVYGRLMQAYEGDESPALEKSGI